MPNHITNRLEILAGAEEVVRLFSTHHLAVPKRDHDNRIIYQNGDTYGWFDESKDLFYQRDTPPTPDIPEGFVPVIRDAWTQFPDFNISKSVFDNESRAAYEMAFKLRPHIKSEYVLTDGRYVWEGE